MALAPEVAGTALAPEAVGMALAPEVAGTALALEVAGTALALALALAPVPVPVPVPDQVQGLVQAVVVGSCDSGCRHIHSRWEASEWGNHLETRIFSLCITTPSDSYWRSNAGRFRLATASAPVDDGLAAAGRIMMQYCMHWALIRCRSVVARRGVRYNTI